MVYGFECYYYLLNYINEKNNMSSAHYFVKNYNIRQVIDLMCYTTLFPHTLTSTQKITRMYR